MRRRYSDELDRRFSDHAEFSGDDLARLSGPVVYAAWNEDELLYIGSSASGLSRPFDNTHHALSGAEITSLKVYPCATLDEARTQEQTLIAICDPPLNKRKPLGRQYTSRRTASKAQRRQSLTLAERQAQMRARRGR